MQCNIKVFRNNTLIYNGTSYKNDGMIKFNNKNDNHSIYFNEDEVLILKNSNFSSKYHFIKNNVTFHDIETVYGDLKIKVITKDIILNSKLLSIFYNIEDEDELQEIKVLF